jgi:hypothetical protein
LIATGGRGKLAGKNGSPARGTEDTGCMGIGKVDSAFGELIDIRCDGPWSLAKTSDPIIHVIYGKEENIWFVFCQQGYVQKQKTESQ